ncbi:MAG: hypothetical protein AB7T07_06065 [Steroidobacteraceae bacterium]
MKLKYLVTACRLLFGIHFLINGLNYTFHFFEIPLPPVPIANVLHDAMVDSGMFSIAKGVEMLTGLMLLMNSYVPLALLIAFPVTCIITFMDVIVIGSAWYGAAVAGLITFILNAGLMLAYFRYYRQILVFRAEPGIK